MTDFFAAIADTISRDGFAFVRAPKMHAALEVAGLRDWASFAASWDDLGIDTYMADGGRYRRRRFAAFRAIIGLGSSASRISRTIRAATTTSSTVGSSGGSNRSPRPSPAIRHSTDGPQRTSQALFDGMTPAAVRPAAWHVELHQFRIEARPGEAGRPTPEGMHRDGVDWVLVLMVCRENIASGETTIYDLVKCPLGSFTLTAPLNSALVDDSRVYHGVTAVTVIDPRLPAYRDVLVVTFRRE